MYKIVVITRILPKWRIEMFEEISNCASNTGNDIQFIFDNDTKVIGEHYSSKYNGELPYKEFKIKRLYRFEYFKGLLRYLNKMNPDTIIVESSLNFISTYVTILYKLLSRQKVSIYGWSSGYFKKYNLILDLIRRVIYKNYNGFFLYHNEAARIFHKHFNITNTFVIGNSPGNKSIDKNIKYVIENKLHEDVKSEYSKYEYIALFVGKLTKSKKVDVLLESAQELNKLNTCIIIIGDGPERERLESLGSNNVYFLGKIETNVNMYFQAADFFIMPGTGGMALLQAVYNHLPIITGFADGIGKDIVENDYNGYINKEISSEYIVDCVKRIIKDNNVKRFSDNMIHTSEKFKTHEIAERMIGRILEDYKSN